MSTSVKYSQDDDTTAMKYIYFFLLVGSKFPTVGVLSVCTAIYIAAASAHTEDVTRQ